MVYWLFLKGGERSNCPDPLEQENFLDEIVRDASSCVPGVVSTQTGTATNSCQQTHTSSLQTATNMSGPDPCTSNAPSSNSSPTPTGIPPAGLIKGSPSSYVAGAVEWTFVES